MSLDKLLSIGYGFIMSKIAEAIYRMLEKLDGEKGVKLIPYRIAEKLKWEVLKWVK